LIWTSLEIERFNTPTHQIDASEGKKKTSCKQYMQYKHKSHKLPTYCQVFGEGFGAQKLVSNQASNKQVCLVPSEKNAKALLVSSLSVGCL